MVEADTAELLLAREYKGLWNETSRTNATGGLKWPIGTSTANSFLAKAFSKDTSFPKGKRAAQDVRP